MEYLKCNFNIKVSKNKIGVRMSDTQIRRRRSFWRLGSFKQGDHELIEDVINRIKTGWVK